MTYVPLARRYRPAKFSDLVGQEPVVKVLANGIVLGREPHALLLTGTRGVGKTTTARLYAKALNCDQGPTPEPCNHCISCQSIGDGCHEDVHEIDGASHTGVDDVRELQASLSYVPQRSKYRIIIIDEVHMLSQSAFNALLKTLEEPPAHVVFIFATTELNKVPATILSRCQLFHLRAMSPATIAERLRVVLTAEEIAFEESALHIIADQGRGSMRDALTFLDQVIAIGGGGVTEANLVGLISQVDASKVVGFLRGLIDKDAEVLVGLISDWEQSGVPLKKVVDDACRFCRHAMIVKNLGQKALGMPLLADELALIQQLVSDAKKANKLDFNRIFRHLVQCSQELSGSVLDRFVLENNCFEWCMDPGMPEDWRAMNLPRSSDSGLQGATVANDRSVVTGVNAPQRNLRAGFQSVVKQAERPGEASSDKSATLYKPAEDLSKKKLSVAKVSDLKESIKPRNQAVPAKVEPQQALANPPSKPASKPKWPGSWQELVAQWMVLKPLEARILEHCHLITYSAEQLTLGVVDQDLGGARLLQPEAQVAMRKQLAELFGFQGVFSVVAKSVSTKMQRPTLWDERQEEKKRAEVQLIQDSETDPITTAAIKIFDAKIEHVEIPGNN